MPTLSPFQVALPVTHTGYSVSRKRRVSLVTVDGDFLTRTEAKARKSGFTREEDTYTDVVRVGDLS